MEQYHGSSKTTLRGTGAKKRANSDKKKSKIGRAPTNTKKADKTSRKIKKGRGKTKKIKLTFIEYANVSTDKGVVKAKILSVLETRDYPNNARRNIITKGAILETEVGKAVVTNRVGQNPGVVNCKLIN